MCVSDHQDSNLLNVTDLAPMIGCTRTNATEPAFDNGNLKSRVPSTEQDVENILEGDVTKAASGGGSNGSGCVIA
jgi:hypothetical protein